jgi:uncharacterized protein (TIGR03118 family)
MQPHSTRLRTTYALALGFAFALGACTDNNDQGVSPNNRFAETKLVADVANAGAANVQANVINPWGIAFGPTGILWVANNGTGTSTTYDQNGVPQSTIVNVPSASSANGSPTGIVFNGTTGFKLNGAPAAFLFAGEDGTIAAWNGGTNASVVVNRSAQNAVYKGIAIATSNGANLLYATDFHNGRVDVFDSTFALVNSFTDATIPAGFAPFGIANINGVLFVTYAKQLAPANVDDEAGNGNGFVDIFNPDGSFVKRFASGGLLNSPWAVVLAPSTLDPFQGDILVGNFGSGLVGAFDPNTGAFVDFVRDHEADPLTVEGLWGLAFGSGNNTNTLFFAAGPGDEAHGLIGTLTRINP